MEIGLCTVFKNPQTNQNRNQITFKSDKIVMYDFDR